MLFKVIFEATVSYIVFVLIILEKAQINVFTEIILILHIDVFIPLHSLHKIKHVNNYN